MHNPYEQGGGSARPPGAPPPFDPNKVLAAIVAILVSIIAGPYVANYTAPFMHDNVFLPLYGEELAGFITGIWKVAMFLIVGLAAQIFVYTSVLFLVTYAGMRLLPSMI